MEFEEHEEQEEEDMGSPVRQPGYDLGRPKMGVSVVGAEGGASTTTAGRKVGSIGTARYRECQKNHAVSIGAHAVDGCGEFIAAGEEGTLDALKCAACNCHRNFHRKEMEGEMTLYQQPQPHPYHQQFPHYYRAAPPPAAGYLHHHLTAPAMAQQRPLALPAAASGGAFSRDEEDMSNPSSSGGGGGGSERKKRHRTKFTQDQKEKMLAFAERLGWRIQKHDEAAVEQFCAETCVKRHVLKVWMHNNKHTVDGGAAANGPYFIVGLQQ